VDRSSVVPVTLVLVEPFRSAAKRPRDQHTDADPEDRHDRDDSQEDRQFAAHDQVSSTVAAMSPRATRIRNVEPRGASAGSRTIAPSSVRRTIA